MIHKGRETVSKDKSVGTKQSGLEWLSKQGNDWFGDKSAECPKCRELAADLSQVVRGHNLFGFAGLVGAMLVAIAGWFVSSYVDQLIKTGNCWYMLVIALYVIVLSVSCSCIYFKTQRDSEKRQQLSFDLMMFSRATNSNCYCKMHAG